MQVTWTCVAFSFGIQILTMNKERDRVIRPKPDDRINKNDRTKKKTVRMNPDDQIFNSIQVIHN